MRCLRLYYKIVLKNWLFLWWLFNVILEQSKASTLRKLAKDSPVHDKNDKEHVSNYRPGSLLSMVLEVIEKYITTV